MNDVVTISEIRKKENTSEGQTLFKYGGLSFGDSVRADNLILQLENYVEYNRYRGIVRTYWFKILNNPQTFPLNYRGYMRLQYQRKASDHRTIFYKEVQQSKIGTIFRVSGIVDRTDMYSPQGAHLWRVIKFERIG